MAADGGVGDAGVPPHVEDVGVGLEVMPAALGADARLPKVARGVVGEPGVGALGAEELDHGVEGVVVHDGLAAVLAGEGRDGHAPVALAGDAPVRAPLDHRADALDGVAGVELDLRELLERPLAQARPAAQRLVHRDEPLARGAEDDGLLAAPAVRVAVVDVLVEDQRAALLEPRDDLGVGLVDLHAGPRAARAHLVAHEEAAVVVDRHDRGDAELLAGEVVVDAVAGRAVDDARAVVEGDVVGVDELARLALVAKDRLLVAVVRELLAGGAPDLPVGAAHELDLAVAKLRRAALGERLGHDLGAAVVHERNVGGLGVADDGVVGGKRPGCGGPDVHEEPSGPGLQALRHRGHLKAHEDGGADLVAVLDLGLGQRRVAVGAPVHGLGALRDGAGVEDGLEDLHVGGVIVVDVGEVGVVPLAQHAQALEALALRVDLLDGEGAAELADLLGGELVELLRAEHGLDLVLDGLAVAVPAGDVRRLVAAHRPVAVDDVLGDLVLRVAEVDRAVGIRGAVVQDELVVPLVLLDHLLVDVVLLPHRQALGLVLSQAGAHGKARARQVGRLLVLVLRHALLLR